MALVARAGCGPRRRRRHLSGGLLLLLVLLLPAFALDSPAVEGVDPSHNAAYWQHNAPVAHQNPHRSGWADVVLDQNETDVIWSVDTGEPILAGAVMDERKVYAVDRLGNVTARWIATGTEAWSHALEEGVAATPALNYGWLYVATLDGNLYALESRTGTLMAEASLAQGEAAVDRQAAGPPARAATLATQGRVFQGTDEGYLYVLDAETLTMIWSFDTDVVLANGTTGDGGSRMPVRSPPAVHDDRVFFTSWNGRVYAMSVYGDEGHNTQRIDWVAHVGDAVRAAPAVDVHRDRVIVATKDGELRAFGAKTGTVVWTSQPTAQFIGGIAVSADQIVARTSDAHLLSLDPEDGSIQWTYTDPSGHLTAPILTRGAVVQASGNGTLLLLERGTGQPLSGAPTPDASARWMPNGAVHAPPAVTSKGIAVVDHAGTITLIGGPLALEADLEATALATTGIGLGPEKTLEVRFRNHGPDPAPDVLARVERDGNLYMERKIGPLGVDGQGTWAFEFQSTPGTHTVTVTVVPVGASDPDSARAAVTREVLLVDNDPANAVNATEEEPAAMSPSGSTFGAGLTRGLLWASVPGGALGLAGGVLLGRRLLTSRRTGAAPAGPLAAA